MVASSLRTARTSLASPLSKLASAARAAERVCASMRSATAAAARSPIFPLKNARRVNSPGLGKLGAAREHRANDFAGDDRGAMNLQLEHIFARITLRRLEKNRQTVV